jgi:hypothetical protein
MVPMFGIFLRMTNPRDPTPRPQRERDKILFSVKEDAGTFPAELWQRFRQTTKDRGEVWINVLRRLIEQYIAQEPPR